MATKKVKTNNLRVKHPGAAKAIVWCQGSVKDCAEHAVLDLQRALRRVKAIGEDENLPEAEGDKLEADLRKHKKAECRGYLFEIVSEEDEYEIEKDHEDDPDEGDIEEDEDEE